MGDDEAFVAAILASPGDEAPELVYADWLEERGDARGRALRLRAALLAAQYIDAEHARIAELSEAYQAAIRSADAEWTLMLGRARPWITERLSIVLVRVHLRTRHGRREDSQWVEFWYDWKTAWAAYYWRQDPATVPLTKAGSRKKTWLSVDKVTGEVAPGPSIVG